RTLELDEVLDRHRRVVYRERREIVEGANLRERLRARLRGSVRDEVERLCPGEGPISLPTAVPLVKSLRRLISSNAAEIHPEELAGKSREEVGLRLREFWLQEYDRKEREWGAAQMR